MKLYGNTFYERINTLLKMQKIDLYKFLQDVGITKQTYNTWKNKANPSGIILFKIADYLCVDPYWLLYGNKESIPDFSNLYLPFTQVKRIYEVLKRKYSDESKDFFYPLDALNMTLLKKWADGILKPEMEQLAEISEKLEVPLSFIINGSGYDLENLRPIESLGSSKIDKYFELNDKNKDIVKEIIESIYIKQKLNVD